MTPAGIVASFASARRAMRRRCASMPWRCAALRLAAASVLACSSAACFSFSRPALETRYYTLTMPGEPRIRLVSAVQIGNFTADQPYSSERLAYRSSPYLLDYYTYHRWAGNPRTIVAAAVRDYLERAAVPGRTPP